MRVIIAAGTDSPFAKKLEMQRPKFKSPVISGFLKKFFEEVSGKALEIIVAVMLHRRLKMSAVATAPEEKPFMHTRKIVSNTVAIITPLLKE